MALLRKLLAVIFGIAGGVLIFVGLEHFAGGVVSQLVAYRPVIALLFFVLAFIAFIRAFFRQPRSVKEISRDEKHRRMIKEGQTPPPVPARSESGVASGHTWGASPSIQEDAGVSEAQTTYAASHSSSQPDHPTSRRAIRDHSAKPHSRMKGILLAASGAAAGAAVVVAIFLVRGDREAVAEQPVAPPDGILVCNRGISFQNAKEIAWALGSSTIEDVIGKPTVGLAERSRLVPSKGKWATDRGLDVFAYESPSSKISASAKDGTVFEVYVKFSSPRPDIGSALSSLGPSSRIDDMERFECGGTVVDFRVTASASHLTFSDSKSASQYWGHLPLMPVASLDRAGKVVKANITGAQRRDGVKVRQDGAVFRLTLSDTRDSHRIAERTFSASRGWNVQVADVVDGPNSEIVLTATGDDGVQRVQLLKWMGNGLEAIWSGAGPVAFVPDGNRTYQIRDGSGLLYRYDLNRREYLR